MILNRVEYFEVFLLLLVGIFSSNIIDIMIVNDSLWITYLFVFSYLVIIMKMLYNVCCIIYEKRFFDYD